MKQSVNSVVIGLMVCLAAAGCAPSSSLDEGFRNPPDSARPRTWWHWVSGNVSKEGITADLEAMKRIGVGGAQCFSVDQIPNEKDRGTVLYMSPQWRELTRHAISECNRLGLELSLVDCEGWSESGGPWITPEQSMQKVVWSEQRVRGGQLIDEPLGQPETVRDFYRDIAVFAFPTLPSEQVKLSALKPKLSSSATTQPVDLNRVIDGDAKTTMTIAPAADKSAFLVIELEKPIRAGSFSIAPLKAGTSGELDVSDDGKEFRKIATIASRRDRSEETVVFEEVNARWIRVFVPKTEKPLVIGEISFGAARVPDFRAKTGMTATILPDHAPAVDVPSDSVVHANQVIDLTAQLNAEGHLKWDAPQGDWTILRIGHTSTGKTSHPAMKETAGLECDKMSTDAVKANFAGMLAKVIADSKPLMGKGLHYSLMDSWEAGCQNWTPLMREEFRQRRGYDPMPWMIAMTGRYVESPEKTERFLWDYRRTIADLIAENHYGLMQELCHQNDLKLTAEAPGIGMPTIADELQCKARTDVPMGEFWVNQHTDNADTRETASAAHIYGTTFAAAESFTATPENAAWTNDPYSLKAQGDEQFCAGINRFVFHRYAHQPDDRKPGITMGPWGINFERTNTWWEPGRAWIGYLTRCQYMLQRGLFVADLVYYYGEGAPRELEPSKLAPAPAGYDYDACDRETLLKRMSVRNGRIALPDGMTYAALVLPETDVMSPPVLAKIKQLVEAGATVIGRKPVKSPSLSDYPNCDEQVRKIADDLWGNIDGKQVTEHALGKGRIVWGKPLDQTLALGRDFESKQEGKDTGIRFIHRRDGDADIYFVANPEQRFTAVNCTFRVSGKAPEFWHPDTGAMEWAAAYSTSGASTTIPIRFDPVGSIFVVFRRPSSNSDPIVSLRRGEVDVLGQATALAQKTPTLEIRKATYGAPDGKPEQQADVTAKVAALVKDGALTVRATNDFAGGDPAYLVVKKLTVEYTLDGKALTKVVPENATLQIPDDVVLSGHPAAELIAPNTLRVWERGEYTLGTSSGRKMSARVSDLPQPLDVEGAWEVRFPSNLGAPDRVTLDRLMPLNEHRDDGVKYFSGTAAYSKTIDISAERLGAGRKVYLDLGAVKNLAEVSVNGKDLGILWKPPFRVDITDAVRPGPNQLEVKVTNLWPNRLIGDQSVPKDRRITWTAYESYKKDSPLLPSGLLGPVRLMTTVDVQAK